MERWGTNGAQWWSFSVGMGQWAEHVRLHLDGCSPRKWLWGSLRSVGALRAWLPLILGLESETQGTEGVGCLHGEIVNGKDKRWKIRH